jgi:hypothetical protein
LIRHEGRHSRRLSAIGLIQSTGVAAYANHPHHAESHKYDVRRLTAHGCEVRVHPASTPARDVLATKPDGVFLSNGPGDPAVLDYAIASAREALGGLDLDGQEQTACVNSERPGQDRRA